MLYLLCAGYYIGAFISSTGNNPVSSRFHVEYKPFILSIGVKSFTTIWKQVIKGRWVNLK